MDNNVRIVWSNARDMRDRPTEVYKYPIGTVFYREKYVNKTGDLVRCVVAGNIWFDHEGQGAVYSAVADEEVQGLDNYWAATWSRDTATSDKELDEYFSKK